LIEYIHPSLRVKNWAIGLALVWISFFKETVNQTVSSYAEVWLIL
jgi:hypothetical protein